MKRFLKCLFFAAIAGVVAAPLVMYCAVSSTYRTAKDNGHEYIIIRCRK